jgi:hypothetical protein
MSRTLVKKTKEKTMIYPQQAPKRRPPPIPRQAPKRPPPAIPLSFSRECKETFVETPEQLASTLFKRIKPCWKDDWKSGGFLAYSKPLVYVACKGANCCYVAIFSYGTLRGYHKQLDLMRATKEFSATLYAAYRCEGDEKSTDLNQQGTNVFIVERMEDSLKNFFTRLAPRFKTDEKVNHLVKQETEKIFDLIRRMNAQGIYHRDAHGGNIMYIQTPRGLVWKFIDPESFYLAHEKIGMRVTPNGVFKKTSRSSLIDEKNTKVWGGILIDVVSVAKTLLDIDHDFYQVFPHWVKLEIQHLLPF